MARSVPFASIICLAFAVLGSACSGESSDAAAGSGGDPGIGGTAGEGGGAGSDQVTGLVPDELGAFSIGYTMFTPVDATRDDRPLPVSVWYPVDEADAATEPLTEYPLQSGFTLASEVAVDDLPASSAGPFPLLVFSHGFGGINTQSTKLMEALASHGFVVASVEHSGNTALDQSDPTPAENRVPDVSFVIDRMLERANDDADLLADRIDGSKVGVLGHSFGGSTAMGTVAGWAGADPDPRVSVIGVIAGGVGTRSFTEQVLASVTAPTMLLVGTLDPNAMENHREAFALMSNAEALFKVEVTGANHTHFANVCDIGNALIDIGIGQDAWTQLGAAALIQPYNETCTDEVFPIAEATRLQSLYMVAHFKRYLIGMTEYDAYLDPMYAEENEPAVVFEAK
jgi:predicted dienelactone hydrolase